MPYSRLYYHFVWATKERLPLIEPNIEQRLHKLIATRGVDLGADIYAVGGVEDHIHMAATVPPSVALADFVRILKGSSSHFLNHELGLTFKWQAEYGVLSFGQKNLETVVAYIKNQRQHHADKTCISYLERTVETTEQHQT